MGESWSKLRNRLENDLLCPSLRGRVHYFRTIYHKAPDQYGRFAVQVDGREVFRANPYNEGRIWTLEEQIKENQNIPPREWTGKGPTGFTNEAENAAAEEKARLLAAEEGVVDCFEIPSLLQQYLNQSIEESLSSPEPVVRMFAILDRRVGKRRLRQMAQTWQEQPEWLQFFCRLRLEAEQISLRADCISEENAQ